MFNLPFEKRMQFWHDFRLSLETSEDPIQDTITFWNTAPLTTIAADPYDREKWPDPWEMIFENNYCSFVKILAILYTLQLTDRFSQAKFEIHITQDKEKSETKYLLFVDGLCIGYDVNQAIPISKLPTNLTFEISYSIDSLL